jgi:hypothetical protein
VAGLVIHLQERPVYRGSTLVVAIAAAAIASYSWSTVPQLMRSEPQAWHLEDWLLGLCVLLTLVPLVLRRRGVAAHWAMASAFAVWLWVVYGTARHHPEAWQLPLLILALAAFGLWFTERRRELLSIRQDARTPHFQVSGRTFAALVVAFALQFALVVALTLSPIALGMRLGTLAIFFLALAELAFFGIVWVFLPKYLTLPSLALVPLIWVVFFGNTPDPSLRDAKFAAVAPERPRLAEHFRQWRAGLPHRDETPIFFVAAGAGGLRAAYWTATMLALADDQTCGEFGRHVYAYSGVSGGSLGISMYLAQRQVWEARAPAERCQPGRRAEMARLLRRDFLAPVVGSLLFGEMTQRFVPFDYLEEDRGSVLAKAWSGAWDEVFPNDQGRFDRPFLEALSAKENTPAVFLNATGVESGQRVVAANVVVRIPGAIDLFRPVQRIVLNTAGLTLREAVLNSARLTYVSPPATVLGCLPPGRVADGSCPTQRLVLWDRLVDGGYFENSGVATLIDIVRAVEREGVPGQARGPGRKDRLFFIVINDSSVSELACPPARLGSVTDSDSNESARAGAPSLSGLTSPIEALLHTRDARGQLEVRRLRTEFSCRDRQLIDWNLFGDQANRRQAEAAGQEPELGWFLSRRSAQWIGTRSVEVARQFPFRHAACHTGNLPAERVNTLVGERSQPNVVCIAQ